MSSTARIGLPFLSAGQVQKELSFNAAIQILDSVSAASVEALPQNSPPSSPAVGAGYIVDSAQAGAWAGKAQYLAGFTRWGWSFVAQFVWLLAYFKSTSTWAVFLARLCNIGEVLGANI